jgi:hypothetical protein
MPEDWADGRTSNHDGHLLLHVLVHDGRLVLREFSVCHQPVQLGLLRIEDGGD